VIASAGGQSHRSRKRIDSDPSSAFDMTSHTIHVRDQVIMTSSVTIPRWPWFRRVCMAAVGVSGHVQKLTCDLERLQSAYEQLKGDHRESTALSHARGVALESVAAQLSAGSRDVAQPRPAWPAVTGDQVAADPAGQTRAALDRVVAEFRDRDDALRGAVVALARSWQTSAHQMQELAVGMTARHPENAAVLETSMRIEHAAAQLARKAQSLTVLCGEWPGQQWPEPLHLVQVVRAAAGRITAYQRVTVREDPAVAIASQVVEPLIHLLAELLDNATQISAPTEPIPVTLKQVFRGWAVEVEDDGLGLDADRLTWAREIVSGRLNPSLAELGAPPQTGLAVVGAFARRHGFRVDLSESVYGGVRAVVVVPAHLTVPLPHPSPRAGERPTLLPPASRHGSHSAGPDLITGAVAPTHGATPDGLPQRRSRRDVAPPPAPEPQPGPAPNQTPEEAGAWLGAFFKAGKADNTGALNNAAWPARAPENAEDQR
jgi:hypothetical protein